MTYTMSNVAVQLFTLRDYFMTPGDAIKTLQRVREIGYECVQFFQMPMPVDEMRSLLSDNGLAVCGADVPLGRLESDFDEVVEEMSVLECPYITYSYAGDPANSYLGGLDDYIRRISAVGRRLQSTPCRFAYHNHSFELVRHGSRAALDYFYEQTADAGILAEIDTYWIQHGGGDPAAWIRRYAGRVPIVHLKDLVIELAEGQVMGVSQSFAEVGAGNMNWESILAASADAGVEWLVVEQDICANDPFESVEKSYRYLAGLLGR